MELCGFTFVVLMFALGRVFKIKSLCSCSYHISGVELSSYTDKLLTYGRTDGQTDNVFIGRSLSTGRAMRLSSIPAKKIMRCRTHVK